MAIDGVEITPTVSGDPAPGRRMEHRASLSAAAREIERIDARRKKLIEMVRQGVAPSVVKEELNANATRREQLEAQVAAIEELPPLLHREMARIYRTKV